MTDEFEQSGFLCIRNFIPEQLASEGVRGMHRLMKGEYRTRKTSFERPHNKVGRESYDAHRPTTLGRS